MEKTKYFSYRNNQFCKGCQLCVRGKKLVLFITGLCPRKCFYCPVSEKKIYKDVIYANEMPIKDYKDIIEEAKLCESEGAGITGGDPLATLDKTLEIIKLLKHEFKNFHIHLYTSFDLVTEKIIEQLKQAKLDEIRFHPDLKDKKLWKKIDLVQGIIKGIEIPVIPDYKKETIEVIDFFKDKVDFFNLNELETADTPYNKVSEKYETKDDISYGIKGSEELALEILEKYRNLNIHYCTAKLKDSVQMMNRLMLRAKNIKRKIDILTPESTLIRGAIYLEKPSFGYREKLLEINPKEELKKLKEIRNTISIKLKINKQDLIIDTQKYRILTSRKIVRRYNDQIKQFNLIPAIVEELATYDQFEIELDFI